MPKKPMGRPAVWTDEAVDKLRQAFAIGCTVSEACLYADIDRTTFYKNCPEGCDLFVKFQELRDKPVLQARATIVKNLASPDTAKWFLEKKRKDEFGSQVDPLGNQPIQIIIKNGY